MVYVVLYLMAHARDKRGVGRRRVHRHHLALVLQREDDTRLRKLLRLVRLRYVPHVHDVLWAQRLRQRSLALALQHGQVIPVCLLQQVLGYVLGHIHAPGVHTLHDRLENHQPQPGQLHLASAPGAPCVRLLVEHAAKGVRRGDERHAVRVEVAALDDKRHVRERAVVDVRLAEVHLGCGRRRGGLQRAQRRGLLGQRVKRQRCVSLRRLRLASDHVQQRVEAFLLHEDHVEVVLPSKVCKRHDDVLAHRPLRHAHQIQQVVEHTALHLLLQPLQRLLHAVLACLQRQLRVHQPLHPALPHNLSHIILVVSDAVQRESGVVL
mmetsp:Transcript_18316/g.62218  ORF Transcript_18316/g.62218 Transcript_18316/m.62218 type:complete len:322 (-) Transcript_18316:1439-2404(-)